MWSVHTGSALCHSRSLPLCVVVVCEQVTGNEGKAPSLPRTGGNEGVGIVMEAGSDSSLAKGDIVVASRPGVGACASEPPAGRFPVALDLAEPFHALRLQAHGQRT